VPLCYFALQGIQFSIVDTNFEGEIQEAPIDKLEMYCDVVPDESGNELIGFGTSQCSLLFPLLAHSLLFLFLYFFLSHRFKRGTTTRCLMSVKKKNCDREPMQVMWLMKQ
jgi:hypothetical protein